MTNRPDPRPLTSWIMPFSLFVVFLLATPTSVVADSACDNDCDAQMLIFSYLADLSDDVPTGNLSEITNQRINCALGGTVTKLRPGWKTVWGPVVLGRHHVAVNTMFVARYKSTNTYVVAIAGTNPKSRFDWLFEDLNINTNSWPEHQGRPWPRITEATWTGLEILKKMRFTTTNREQLSLLDFLRGVARAAGPSNKATIYVTGHSLGGALAPALALWLSDKRSGHQAWDPASHTTLQVYAYAGPTPGTQSFASYMNAKFPGDPGVDTQSQDGMRIITNALDIVPHAFHLENMEKIHDLYKPVHIFPSKAEAFLLASLTTRIRQAKEQGTDYANLGRGSQVRIFPSHLVPTADLRNATNPPCLPVKNAYLAGKDPFLLEAVFQHVCGYPQALGLPNAYDEMHTCSQRYPGN